MFREAAGFRALVGITVYDYAMARIAEDVGADLLIVGDTLGPVVYGRRSPVETGLASFAAHVRAVRQGAGKAVIAADLPEKLLGCPVARSVGWAVRELAAVGVDAVKVEGGAEVLPVVRGLQDAGVEVVGHLSPAVADPVGAARALADAGVLLQVLVGLDERVRAQVTASARELVTFGYGDGGGCHGVLRNAYGLIGALPYVESGQESSVGSRDGALARSFLDFKAQAARR
jgi:3-methyl-2-oxobutanoate hydroxymethyltransferase